MNLADVISRHARETPLATAVFAGDSQIDYQTFDRAIWRAAAALQSRGISPGDVVGIAMRSSPAYLVVAYALARMGAVQISLPLSEPEPVRARYKQRFGVQATIGDADVDPEWLVSAAMPVDESLRAPGGDAGWRIAMTSGTTAEPKAVLQSHAAHCAWREVYARAIPGRRSDRLLCVIELEFYAAIRQCMELHWAGAAVVFPSQPIQSSDDFIAALKRYPVNYLHLLPTHLHRLMPALRAGDSRIPEIRVLRTGAMIASHKLRRDVRERLTPNMVITYGTNDVGSLLTYADRRLMEQHPGSVGIASPGVQLEVVDDDDVALPAGEPGHIRVKAPGMPAGYIGNPQATAKTFRDGWYYTGDLGMLSDAGALYFKGRADDLMNFDGIKLYPADIEAALLEHPAVAEATSFPLRVVAHQDVPVAAVVLREPVADGVLVAWCRDRLGIRAPRLVAVLKTLPRNSIGKVLKREVAQTVLQNLRRR